MDNLRYLTAFVDTVKCGSFSAAAEKHQITVSAMSRTISKLEQSLGVRLLNRTTRHIQLTSEGQTLFTKLITHLAAIDAAIDGAHESSNQPTGVIRVSVGATFGRYVLIPVLHDFLKLHPLLQVDLNVDDMPKGLVQNGFDIGINVGHGAETSCVSRLLCRYPTILVASPQYLAAYGIPKTPADLSKHECIAIKNPIRRIDWKLEPIRGRSLKTKETKSFFVHSPNGRLGIEGQWDITLTAALQGFGIATTSIPAALQFLRQNRLKVVLPNYRLRDVRSNGGKIFIHYPHREYLPAKTRIFIEYLVEYFNADANTTADLSAFSA